MLQVSNYIYYIKKEEMKLQITDFKIVYEEREWD